MGGPDRGGELQVLLDGQLLVEGVVLRDVGDVLEEGVEIPVEGSLVEQHLSRYRLELTGQRAQQGALPAAARPHDADHLAPLDREVEVVERGVGAPEAADEIAHIEVADDVALLLDDALGEIAAQHLARIDADRVAVLQLHGAPDGQAPHHDRPVGLQHLDPSLLQLVVTGDPEGHLAADARGDEDVIVVEAARVVGGDILGLRSLEFEAPAEGADASLELLEVELPSVAEEDLVGELGIHGRSLAQGSAPQGRPQILERGDAHLEPEGDLKIAVAAAGLLETDLLVVDRHEDVGERHVPLRVEVEEQVLAGNDLFADEHPLAGIDAAEFARFEQSPLDDEALRGEVLQDDQVVVAVGEQPLVGRELAQGHIAPVGIAEGKGLQRGDAVVEERRVGLFVRIELVDDVDRLGGHAELAHEIMVGGDLLRLHPGAGDQVEELDAEQDLPVIAQFEGELGSHDSQILLLLERLPEEPPQLGIDGLRIVVAQESEAGIDFLLEHLAVDAREGGKHLDQGRQEIRALRDRLWPPAQTSPPSGRQVLETRGAAQEAVDHQHAAARLLAYQAKA